MAGMTQKELKKPYFHCGPLRQGKKQKIDKRLIETKMKVKILKYLLLI